MADPALDLDHFKALLLARRDELHNLSDASADARATVELDQTSFGRLSRIDALQGQEMAKATEERRHHEVERIEYALERIAEGTYGECLNCGERIARKRLELDPSATLCIACASTQRS
ncbi:MAG: TraR/DksA family transcriptional regulator [Geminicoccaceae bacterium]